MAVRPDDSGIKPIQSIQTYLTDLFGIAPPGFPSFFEYLTQRGIPQETFSAEQYQFLALQSEMMQYTTILQRIYLQHRQEQSTQAADQEFEGALESSTLDQLKATAMALRNKLDQVDKTINTIAHAPSAPA